MASAVGEASMKNTHLGITVGEQARQFAGTGNADVVSEQVNHSSLKAGYQPGSASVDINVDNEGHFNGSRVKLVYPFTG
ncbi:hypothetical protein KCP78_07845 [Salmonella enterica subsp. enterica]|nr:hypothetical protein KCP78_07845 [Salmonella enterica subsp. enterica]